MLTPPLRPPSRPQQLAPHQPLPASGPNCRPHGADEEERRWRFINFETKFTDDAAELRSDPVKFRPTDDNGRVSIEYNPIRGARSVG